MKQSILIISYLILISGFTTTETSDSSTPFLQREFSGNINLLWEPGQEIWIEFIGGTSFQKAQVKKYAKEWSKSANLNFKFGNYGWSHVRISFNQKGGHWSFLGRRSTNNQNSASMNIALNQTSSESYWSRVVLHEFGHMLGFIHEHQNPCGNPITFKNKEELIKYYQDKQDWSREKIKHNIFKKHNSTYCFPFDPKSIMLYSIPAKFLEDDLKLMRNKVLSDGDRAFAEFIYPKN